MMTQDVLPLENRGVPGGWRRLSDPVIYRTLHLAAIVGCLLGLLLFAKFEAGRNLAMERQQTTVWARTISARTEAILLQGGVLAEQAAGLLSGALESDTPASQQREIARRMSELLDDGPASGLVVLGETGNVLRAYGFLPAVGYVWPKSEALPDRDMDLLLIDAGNGKFLASMSNTRVGNTARIVIVYPSDVFSSRMKDAVMPSLLLNRDGDLLTASAGAPAYAGKAELNILLGILQRAARRAGGERAAIDDAFRDGAVVAATSIVGNGEAQAITFRVHSGAFGTLWASRTRLALLMGPALLATLLALSLIQNEWRRQDKGDDNSENMAARARIAADIVSAGIVDWSVDEGSVDYSDGWAALLGYENIPQHEEIFDWIERIHPDDRFAARSAYEDLQQGNVTDLTHEIRVRTTDRSYIRIRERARMHQDSSGFRHIVLVQLAAS